MLHINSKFPVLDFFKGAFKLFFGMLQTNLLKSDLIVNFIAAI